MRERDRDREEKTEKYQAHLVEATRKSLRSSKTVLKRTASLRFAALASTAKKKGQTPENKHEYKQVLVGADQQMPAYVSKSSKSFSTFHRVLG